MIRELLEEEPDRNSRVQEAYATERDELSRGSVTVKQRGGKAYCHLKYRDGSRTVTDYVGTAAKAEAGLRAAVARHKEVESGHSAAQGRAGLHREGVGASVANLYALTRSWRTKLLK